MSKSNVHKNSFPLYFSKHILIFTKVADLNLILSYLSNLWRRVLVFIGFYRVCFHMFLQGVFSCFYRVCFHVFTGCVFMFLQGVFSYVFTGCVFICFYRVCFHRFLQGVFSCFYRVCFHRFL